MSGLPVSCTSCIASCMVDIVSVSAVSTGVSDFVAATDSTPSRKARGNNSCHRLINLKPKSVTFFGKPAPTQCFPVVELVGEGSRPFLPCEMPLLGELHRRRD